MSGSRPGRLLLTAAWIGAAAVVAGLFVTEYAAQRHAELDRQRRRDAAAQLLLEQALRDEVEAKHEHFAWAAADPLGDARGLMRQDGARPVLPAALPAPRPAPSRDDDAVRRRAALVEQLERSPDPAAWAAFARDRDAHHLGHVDELGFDLRAAEAAQVPALREPLHEWLRSGLGGPGASLPRTVLASRAHVDADTFRAAVARTTRLLTGAGLSTEAFAERAGAAPHPVQSLRPGVSAAIDDDEVWAYLREGDDTRGVRVDRAALEARLGERLSSPARADDVVVTLPRTAGARPASALSPRTRSPQDRAIHQRQAAFLALQLVVLAAAAFLGLLAAWWYESQVARERAVLTLQNRFLAGISHELKTPLSSIRLLAETLERRLRGDDRARDYPARIVQDVDGLSALVDNLLSYQRLEQAAPLRTEPMSLDELVDEVAEEVQRISPRPVRIDRDIPAAISVAGDAGLLRLVFSNLFRNARDHSRRDIAEVEVAAGLAPDRVRITVRDNGPGIADDERGDLFTPFVRGRGGRSRGSGLGLSLCAQIMSLHGGTIELGHTDPGGTTFVLTLPLAASRPIPEAP